MLWTNSIASLFAKKRSSDKVLAPSRCTNGHELTPTTSCQLSAVPAGVAGRGAERAAAWRRRRSTGRGAVQSASCDIKALRDLSARTRVSRMAYLREAVKDLLSKYKNLTIPH